MLGLSARPSSGVEPRTRKAGRIELDLRYVTAVSGRWRTEWCALPQANLVCRTPQQSLPQVLDCTEDKIVYPKPVT